MFVYFSKRFKTSSKSKRNNGLIVTSRRRISKNKKNEKLVHNKLLNKSFKTHANFFNIK